MRRGAFLLFVLLAAAPSEAALRPLAASGRWAAFARDAPRSCYAISEPVQSLRPAGWKPFAAIGFWPDRRISGQVHFRLGREKRPGSAVLLRISDQTFQLIAGKADAWAPDRTADALIVSAMRSGVDMAIETRAANGTLVRESYQLAGAATAIDAAAVACAR